MGSFQLQKAIRLLRERGLRYTYNLAHFHILYTQSTLINRFIRSIGAQKLFLKTYPYIIRHPSYIEIEVTTRCNLKCKMCEHTYWNEPPRDMTFEEFKGIVDQFPKLKWIGLTGIGESFLNKSFLDMLWYVKSKNIYVEIADSCYFLNEKISKELVDMRLDHFMPSIDAATEKTYEKIRIGAKFDKVIDNVGRLIEIRNSNDSQYPELTFHYVIMKDNIGEVTQYLDLVNSLDRSAAVLYTRMLHKFEEIKDLFTEIPPNLIKEVMDKANKIGTNVAWNADIPLHKPPVRCCTAWTMPFIFVTGHVIPCCASNEANRRDFQKEYSLGNIFEQSFKEIWAGKYREFVRNLRSGKVPEFCMNCSIHEARENL